MEHVTENVLNQAPDELPQILEAWQEGLANIIKMKAAEIKELRKERNRPDTIKREELEISLYEAFRWDFKAWANRLHGEEEPYEGLVIVRETIPA